MVTVEVLLPDAVQMYTSNNFKLQAYLFYNINNQAKLTDIPNFEPSVVLAQHLGLLECDRLNRAINANKLFSWRLCHKVTIQLQLVCRYTEWTQCMDIVIIIGYLISGWIV